MMAAQPPPRLQQGPNAANLRINLSDCSEVIVALKRAAPRKAFNIQDLRLSISDAINNYIDASYQLQSRETFVGELSLFKKQLDKFIEHIPDATTPLAEALCTKWIAQTNNRALWGEQDMRGLDPSRGLAFAFPDPTAFWSLKEGLHRLAEGLNELAVEERVGRRGRPPQEAIPRVEDRFVRSLRMIYEHATGIAAKAGKNSAGTASRDRAIGYFADFVKAVEKTLIEQVTDRLISTKLLGSSIDALRSASSEEARQIAEEFRISSLERAIENACGSE